MSASKGSLRIMAKNEQAGPLIHLFDGHVYIFRAYYSMPPMETPDGTACNAAYGFANTLIRYLTEESPSHVGVCFDAAMTSFRNDIEPEYKAQRGDTPEDLEPQFDLCHEISVALGLATFEVDNYEADDLLATICSRVIARRGRTRIVTTDKDLCQLVREDGRAEVYDLAKNKIYDADAVREKFGVSPDQIPDYLGLVGDAIDNLPGVPGVGPKSAAAVLRVFPTIESIPAEFDRWSEVEARGARRLADRITEHRSRALKTKKLATVLREVPGVTPGLKDLTYRGADRERTEELFDRLGWNRIRDRISKWQASAEPLDDD
jgi:DNA polymerase-1